MFEVKPGPDRTAYMQGLARCGMAYVDIGHLFGLTRERVRQLVGNTTHYHHPEAHDPLRIMRRIRERDCTTFPAAWWDTIEGLGLRTAVERLVRLRRRRDNRARWGRPEYAAPHGTGTRYQYHGCRCDECRAWNREHMRRFIAKRRNTTPPAHNYTGYQLYGCRCPTCKEAYRVTQKRGRIAAKHRPCPPNRHGGTGYQYYGCRCDVCRAWASSRARARRERRQAARLSRTTD